MQLHSSSVPESIGVGPIPSPALPPAVLQVPNIMPIKFWIEYKTPADAKAGSKVEGEEWVTWVAKGQQNGPTTSEAIKRLMPNPAKGRKAAIEWMAIEPYYRRWKDGQNIDVITGTPLHAWAGVDRNLVEELAKFRIYSVEDLADLVDHRISSVPLPGIRDYVKRAKAFVEAKTTSDLEGSISKREERIAELEEHDRERDAQMKEMQDQIAQLLAGREQIATTLVAGPGSQIPNPDDEFVEVGPNDRPVSARR